MIRDIIETPLQYINKIKEIIVDLYDLMMAIFNFLPSPFKEILLAFLGIFLAIGIYKILKG